MSKKKSHGGVRHPLGRGHKPAMARRSTNISSEAEKLAEMMIGPEPSDVSEHFLWNQRRNEAAAQIQAAIEERVKEMLREGIEVEYKVRVPNHENVLECRHGIITLPDESEARHEQRSKKTGGDDKA